MATAYTSLLGLALPVTGELSGSWGDTVNDSITSLLDSAISGTTTLSADADVTLTSSDGVADQARQAILLWTAGGSTTRNITAPAQSKAYFVINKTSSTQSIVIRGAGPTTGVTVLAGTQSLVVWNGVDFVEVASGNVDGPASSTDNAVARFDGTTGKLIQNSVVTIADTTGNMAGVGTLGVGAITTSGALTYGGVTLSNSVTGTGSMVLATSPTLTTPALGTPSALVGTNITGTAAGLTAGNVTTNANLTGAVTSTGNATVLGSFSSANLAGALTDETGTGSAVFANSPTLVTPALGTPASGVVTNLTGTASININGTVGATTPTTGAFTTLTTSSTVTLNGATANGVAYANGSKVLTTGSALTFDGTNLAIGASPTFYGGQVATAGSIAITGGNLLKLWNTGGTGVGGISSPGTDTIAFGLGGSFTEGMRLTSTGLGIGTTTPSARLDVRSDAATVSAWLTSTATTAYSPTTSASVVNARLQLFGGNATGAYTAIRFSQTGSFEALFGAVQNAAGTADFIWQGYNGAAYAERMRLDSSGNLGLGVTPSAWTIGKAFQVNGASVLSTGTEMYLSANAFYGASAWTYRQTDFAAQYYQLNGAHVWRTAPSGTAGNAISFTQAATLTANGEYLVGLTSATGVAKLQVSGAIRTTGFTVATLPAGTVGMRTYVTDALAPSFSATVTGGGAVTIPVFYNGTNWIVA